MEAKEKAKELYEKFRPFAASLDEGIAGWHKSAKACAIIAVDEMIDFISEMADTACWVDGKFIHNACDYWNQVKQEIEKL